MRIIRGMVYTDGMCFEPGEVVIDGERIENVARCESDVLTEKEAQTYILPGWLIFTFTVVRAMTSVTARRRQCVPSLLMR